MGHYDVDCELCGKTLFSAAACKWDESPCDEENCPSGNTLEIKKKLKAFYLAGPMSWVPKFNIPLFERVAKQLRAKGYYVYNPAELDSDAIREVALKSETGDPSEVTGIETYGEILGRDVRIVIDEVDAVALLPDWIKSTGARIETAVAKIMGKEIYEVDTETLELEPIDIYPVTKVDEIQEQTRES